MYKVPFVDYPEHYRRIWNEIMEVIEEALSNDDLTVRDQLRQFEENIASFVGVKYAVGVNSGTDALFLSLKDAGIRPGDEVLSLPMYPELSNEKVGYGIDDVRNFYNSKSEVEL